MWHPINLLSAPLTDRMGVCLWLCPSFTLWLGVEPEQNIECALRTANGVRVNNLRTSNVETALE